MKNSPHDEKSRTAEGRGQRRKSTPEEMLRQCRETLAGINTRQRWRGWRGDVEAGPGRRCWDDVVSSTTLKLKLKDERSNREAAPCRWPAATMGRTEGNYCYLGEERARTGSPSRIKKRVLRLTAVLKQQNAVFLSGNNKNVSNNRKKHQHKHR